MSFIAKGELKCGIILAVMQGLGWGQPFRKDTLMPDAIRIQMVLDKVQDFLEQWLESHLKSIYQKDFWQMAVLNALTAEQREDVEESGAKSLADLDLAMLIAVFLGNFRALRKSVHVDPELTDMAKHVKKIRNLYAHRNAKTIRKPDLQKVKYHIDTLRHFLEGLGADVSLLREVDRLYNAIDSGGAKPLPVQAGAVHSSNEIKISVSTGSIRQQGVSKIKERSSMSVSSKTELKPSVAAKRYSLAQIEKWCQMINFARSTYEDVFSAAAKIVAGEHRDDSSVKGRGCWDYLIVMPFSCDADKALVSVQRMWNCPDSVPYCEAGHVVWEFPYCAEPQPQAKEGEFYSAGYVPPVFDAYITAQLGTEYRPDANRVNNNLHAVAHDAHWYLGNYFPRSFVETFCIYDYVLSKCLDEVRAGKDTLTICDVGIGSGGATYGLIWALCKRLRGDASFKKITVYGLDGNAPALRLFEEMKSVMADAWPIEYEFVTKQVHFSEGCILSQEAVSEKVDFVITSKCLQELVHGGIGLENIYKTFLADAQNVVSDCGLISVVEISATERMSALNRAFADMGGGRAILLPRASDGVGCVGEECFKICSTRIMNCIHESILFAVAGSETFSAKFSTCLSEANPATNKDDSDSELAETTHEGSMQ